MKPLYLVTGAAGFIGARFVESCNARRIPVISVDRASHFESRTEHHDVAFAQVVDRDALFDWLRAERPALSGIIHLGACTDTGELDVAYLAKTNIEYSKRLWSFATEQKIPMIYASSAATYGDGALGYGDDERLIPDLRALNPYGESKRLFDLWALDEEKQGRSPPAWSGYKFFNVYGFGERHKEKMASVILHAYDQLQKTGSVKLFKSHRDGIRDGEQKRDFIFVEDTVAALHFALEKPVRRGIFNLGTGRARTFLDLAQAVFSALGTPARIEFVETPPALRERYQYFTEAKIEKLRAEGFSRPFTPLEEGVRAYLKRLGSQA